MKVMSLFGLVLTRGDLRIAVLTLTEHCDAQRMLDLKSFCYIYVLTSCSGSLSALAADSKGPPSATYYVLLNNLVLIESSSCSVS